MKTNTRKRNRRIGAAAVEFAVVAPLILTFVLGLIEWGRFEMVRQATSTAAFSAAREGVIPGATLEDVENQARSILETYFVSGETIDVNFGPQETRVLIEVPMSENSFVLKAFFGDKFITREFELTLE